MEAEEEVEGHVGQGVDHHNVPFHLVFKHIAVPFLNTRAHASCLLINYAWPMCCIALSPVKCATQQNCFMLSLPECVLHIHVCLCVCADKLCRFEILRCSLSPFSLFLPGQTSVMACHFLPEIYVPILTLRFYGSYITQPLSSQPGQLVMDRSQP